MQHVFVDWILLPWKELLSQLQNLNGFGEWKWGMGR